MTHDAAYYEDLRGRARGALIAVADQLPARAAALIDELIDANECGVAVEMLSEALVEAEAVLTLETVATVEGLVETMGLDEDVAGRLRRLIRATTGGDEA